MCREKKNEKYLKQTVMNSLLQEKIFSLIQLIDKIINYSEIIFVLLN